MIAEFNWWLLIVGLVVGAGLAWLVLADARRREEDLEEAELAEEAVWLETAMAEAGTPIDPLTAEHMLVLHRRYLGLPRSEEPSELDGGRSDISDPPTAPPNDDAARAATGWSPSRADEPEPPPAVRAADRVGEDEPTVRSGG